VDKVSLEALSLCTSSSYLAVQAKRNEAKATIISMENTLGILEIDGIYTNPWNNDSAYSL